LLSLWFRAFRIARIAAFVQVSVILVGWDLAQFPHLVAPDVTIQNAAAPQESLRERDSIIDGDSSLEHFEQLVAAVRELQVVVSAPLRG
jgi:hypothetical protein